MQKWRRFILGCTLGNVLEWYDFILYGFFATILSRHFFPSHSHFISLLIVFSVFASGCLIRPLGSLLFGHIGDRYGRKRSLMITIVIISLATTSMGLLPTYQQVGVWAPILLTLCRLMQGLAVSGEEVGAGIFLTENAPRNEQCYASSIILGSVYVGLLLGSVTAFLITIIFSKAVVASWAWRVPFLLSFIYGVVAFYYRWRDIESPRFLLIETQKRVRYAPIKEVFSCYKEEIAVAIMLCFVFAVAIYLFAVYLPSFFNSIAGYNMEKTLLISALSLLVMSILVPLVGKLADRVGAKRLYSMGCLGFVVMSYPIFYLLSLHNISSIIVAEAILCVLLSLVAGSIFPLLMQRFPITVRYTGVGIAFNIAMTLFGSIAPIVAITLVKYTGNNTAPFWYLLIAAVVSLVALPSFLSDNFTIEGESEQRAG